MVKWFEKLKPKLFNFVVCNPCQSSPSLTILVPNYGLLLHACIPWWFSICTVLFSGFFQFKGYIFSLVKITQNTVTELLRCTYSMSVHWI